MNHSQVNWWRTSFDNGEAEALARALSAEHVSQGPLVAEFEQQLAAFLNVPYVVATTSGSMALLMSLMASGVKAGDEVIVPNRTWIATAHAAVLIGATVKLVDVEPDLPIMDPMRIEAAITKRTKAIIPVHMGGRAVNMRALNAIAQRHGITVIEDAAQALGSRNADGLLGTQSSMGCFSLSVAKIIATGQGGFIATRDEYTYRMLISIRTHGVGDVVNADWERPGFNFRFTDLLAAIGLQQIKVLPERIVRVNRIYQMYAEGLAGLPFIQLIPVNVEGGEIPIYVEALCETRNDLVTYLADQNIQCRPFYPNLNYADYLHVDGAFPNAEPFGRKGLYLPCGPEQPIENVRRVIAAIREFRPS